MLSLVQDLLHHPTSPVGELRVLDSGELPPLQAELLNHSRDMTGTLRKFVGEELSLRALDMRLEDSRVHRRVLLLAGERPVEYGAIRIELDAVPQELVAAIQEARVPLGGLLTSAGIELQSEVRALIETSDPAACEALGCAGPLYGRLARLGDTNGRVIADVVEILPDFENLEPNG